MAGRADAVGITVIDREERMVAGRQSGRNPRGGCVARGAGGGPGCGHVIWIRGSREICLVARVAVSWCACKNVIDVA